MKENDTSFVDSKGFPKYKRKSTDLNIVPYNPLIIWTTYDQITIKTTEVLQNYEEYFNKIRQIINSNKVC